MGAAAASHSVIEGGATYGHSEMISPVNDRKNKPMVPRKGVTSRPRRRASQISHTSSAVNSGTGAKYRKFGNENQRAAIRSLASGVHTLTISTNARIPPRA